MRLPVVTQRSRLGTLVLSVAISVALSVLLAAVLARADEQFLIDTHPVLITPAGPQNTPAEVTAHALVMSDCRAISPDALDAVRMEVLRALGEYDRGKGVQR